jgi:hypothetical protein
MRKRKGERSCGECSSEGKGVICWKSEGELLSPFSWIEKREWGESRG